MAASAEGEAMVRDLATATGTAVAASDQAVGSAALGGSWQLDVRTAGAQGVAPFAASALGAFHEVLGWNPAASMATARSFQTATLLNNGQVLVSGGQDSNANALSSAELYNPISNTWSSAGTMSATSRYDHTATLLNNGKVLVVGGKNSSGVYFSALLYDPTMNTWSSAGSMTTARYGQTATLLGNGKVLVTGGGTLGATAVSSAELYNPSSNTSSSAAPMATPRLFATATLLGDGSGRVLVTGGYDQNFNLLSSAELYNPSSNTWSSAGSMKTARQGQTATLLGNGKVLVTGGTSATYNAELYNPATNAWSPTYMGDITPARKFLK